MRKAVSIFLFDVGLRVIALGVVVGFRAPYSQALDGLNEMITYGFVLKKAVNNSYAETVDE